MGTATHIALGLCLVLLAGPSMSRAQGLPATQTPATQTPAPQTSAAQTSASQTTASQTSATQSVATRPPLDQTLRLFATCTGRLSAMVEFQWLIQDPAAAQTESHRDAMAQLLEAALPAGAAPAAMALRLQAKAAEADLLLRALQREGRWALTRARTHLAGCTALLLS